MKSAAHTASDLAQGHAGPGGEAESGGNFFVARWELDLSRVYSLIRAAASGARLKANWVEVLINGARIAALDERAALVVGAPVTREEMIGQPVASFAPPDSWQTLAGLIVDVASDRPGHRARKSPINSFMLRDAHLKVWGEPGKGYSKQLSVAVEGILADDRSPWAVRASEQRYKRLIHHLPTALLQVDARYLDNAFQKLRADGVIELGSFLDERAELISAGRKFVQVTDANEAAVRLLGARDAAALLGPVDFLFDLAPDSAKRVIVAHFEGKRSHSEAIKLRTLDGRLLDVQLSVTYPNSPERLDVTLISLEDITDRLRTESQLRQLQAEYGRATRIATLGELASSIAHEVNQPLAAIAMNAETSLRWLGREEPNLPKVIQLTERIVASARHASEIVQRVRGMAARSAPERLPTDLNEVVEEALLFVRHDLEARAIRLTTDLRGNLPTFGGDRVLLQQVIVNLVLNSIQALAQKYERGGAIELRTGVDEEGAIVLAIRDNGPGIPAEYIDRIFDGFFTTKADGMGIGLSVCQSIIAAHGGRIEACNHPGGGAVLRFSLPPIPDAQ